jgi:hypothetical protein
VGCVFIPVRLVPAWRESLHLFALDLQPRRRQWHQSLAHEISARANGAVADEFLHEFGETGDQPHMGLLHVDEQRA